MWVVTRLQAHLNDDFEQALNAVVESEAETCPVCKAILEATGALPAHCPACGRVRSITWQRAVEELASREIAGRRARRNDPH